MGGIVDEGNGLDRGLSNLEQLEFVGHPLPRASSLPSHKLVVFVMLPVGRREVHTAGNGGAASLFRCSPVLYGAEPKVGGCELPNAIEYSGPK
jgi:hypothetical protein